MTDDEAHQQILSFNFHYLSLLQRHLLTDALRARYIFHLDEDIAAQLIALDSYQLLELSNSYHVLCDFALNDPQQLKRRLQAPAHLKDAYRAQAIILKASQRRHNVLPRQDAALWGDHP